MAVVRSLQGPVNSWAGREFGALDSEQPRFGTAQHLPLPRVSVVIPTLNEAANLPHVLPRIPSWVHEVVLVDGHSTDGTPEVARDLWPNHHVVVAERRRRQFDGLMRERRSPGTALRLVTQEGRGKGAALRMGFAAATGDIIVMFDADGSADAVEIPRFLSALLNGADFAKGSRFLPGGGSADITRIRRFGNWGLTTLVNMLYGARYTDLCYGLNAFWAHCLPYMDVDCDGFEVETQINLRVAKAHLNIREVPSFEGSRIHGVSNLNAWRDGRRVLRTIVRERIAARISSAAVESGSGNSANQMDAVKMRTGLLVGPGAESHPVRGAQI
jgi:glycosyltransferase involved in cell wall biosynthesis